MVGKKILFKWRENFISSFFSVVCRFKEKILKQAVALFLKRIKALPGGVGANLSGVSNSG